VVAQLVQQVRQMRDEQTLGFQGLMHCGDEDALIGADSRSVILFRLLTSFSNQCGCLSLGHDFAEYDSICVLHIFCGGFPFRLLERHCRLA
jgi:hypothetical protein